MRRDHALLERLLALDAEAVALRGELARHQAPAPAPIGGLAPAPRGGIVRHPWPLADEPGRAADTLDRHERRPDDAAILAARDGAAFLAGLDAATAADALCRRPHPALRHDAPDVSVIIPVHGQLGWTLNALDALLPHASRRGFEVIVVDDASPDRTASVIAGLAARVPGVSLLRRPRNEGFIAAANAGAASARGRVLVLLNNDTRVAAGWLDALIDSFDLFPRAGLVGSKLLYPDGSLQEAGAILWRDGSAWNHGRGADPNRPEFCHARRVDYISGASIAVPAALWRALDGLDPHFAPAYGEDADLAMRVRAAGHEVWYQPTSRVIHYEGRTGGTDTHGGGGAKAHQVVNLKKLFVRWHGVLATHGRPGSDPYQERERGVRRRALVVDASTPTPKQDAGSGVTMESIRILQRLGYKVHFAPQDNMLFQPGHTEALQRIGVECAHAPHDVGFDEYLARHGALFDVILVFRPAVLEAIEPAVRRHAPAAALVFSNADLHFLRRERQAALSGETVDPAARTRELALIARTPVTLTLSTFERELLAREAPGACVLPQPFPHAVVGTRVGFAAREGFLFLGGYGHPPNVDAAVFLARDILPVLRRELPAARVILAGANPTPEVLALAGPGVEVPGAIDDLAPLFDRARVFVCPVRAGAGVKGKVIAAMAHGLPVVATGCGAEGIEVTDGRDLLVADGAVAVAAACARLHRDPGLWRDLSAAGLAHVARACSAEAGERALAAAIDAAYRRQLLPAPPPGR